MLTHIPFILASERTCGGRTLEDGPSWFIARTSDVGLICHLYFNHLIVRFGYDEQPWEHFVHIGRSCFPSRLGYPRCIPEEGVRGNWSRPSRFAQHPRLRTPLTDVSFINRLSPE